MDDLTERYDIKTAAAWFLGHAKNTGIPVLSPALREKKIDECSEEDLYEIFTAGRDAGLKVYPFKNVTQGLDRTRRVLGFLRSVPFETLLDVGSGRGVFLIPFIKEFPHVSVTSVDLLASKVDFLNELAAGGFGRLRAVRADICDMPFEKRSFDVVTMLEVLEHIPCAEKAVSACLAAAERYVVVTVPSRPDNNPEHIHLFTKDKLASLFESAGCKNLHFDGVPGHIFMTARVD